MFKLYSFVIAAVLLFPSFTCVAQNDKNKPAVYTDNILFGGCWFTPHNSEIYLTFSGYSDFRFHDIDSNEHEEVLNGKFLLDGHNLWLIYNDRPKRKFDFYKTEGADAHFVIRSHSVDKTELLFVHGDCE